MASLYEEVSRQLKVTLKSSETYEAFALRLALKANGLKEEAWKQLTEPVQVFCNEVLIADDKRKAIRESDPEGAEKIPFPPLDGFPEDRSSPPPAASPGAPAAPTAASNSDLDDTRGRPRMKPEGLHSYTERWNALVPEALGLGLKGVRTHTSDFSTYGHAQSRVKWLEDAIKTAKAAKTAEKAPEPAE